MSQFRRLLPFLGALAALVFTVGVAGCGGSAGADDNTLRVALVPNIAPADVQAEYGPLAKAMEQKLGMKVELTVPTSYPAVVEAMANNRIDLALFGGLTYVQARQRAKVTPLVTDINPETGTTKYDSLIIVPAGSDVHRIEQLKGKTFAFGSISSTSGSLYPALMLRNAGIDYHKDIKAVYTSGHDATAAAVANGKVDGGGLEGRIMRRLIADGTVDGSKIRVIQRSGPIEGYPWVASDSVNAGLRERIAKFFLGLRDPKLLDLLHVKGYARVKPSDYDFIQKKADELGLLTATG
jgi:phosphonate transport system substrate-binding protein